MRRLFAEPARCKGSQIELDESESRHAAQVLRARAGEKFEVLNGAGDINWTRQTASKIQSLAYTVKKVGRADRFDYPQSAVYYSPGGRLIAVRLARQVGFVTRPLPGGTNEKRLVVIVGPKRGPG